MGRVKDRRLGRAPQRCVGVLRECRCGGYAKDETIEVAVRFHRPVQVVGTPRLELQTGANARDAEYVCGSGTGELVFAYQVGSSDNDDDGISLGSDKLTFNGGTIGSLSAAENPEVIERFEATFEQYWQEPEFEDYAPGRDAKRLDHALSSQRGSGSPEDITALSLLVDVSPKPHQAVALEALEAERLRGHHRNLVVAATGTGKTWIAAFDFKRLRDQGVGRSLLFVAHRDEILRQSQHVFQLVLREPGFGERLVGGERPHAGRHVFASVQSLANRVDEIEPDGFDVVIVDEFHHAAAASYERLLSRLKPKILLGLTATPERADGRSVLDWFDGRIAGVPALGCTRPGIALSVSLFRGE